MKKQAGLWSLMGFGVTSLAGTLLHFLYDATGGWVWVAPFSGVNESTWEHMKLLFWPMLAVAVVQSRHFSSREDYWCIKRNGALIGLALIPLLFYTYNGAIGTSPDWLNIGIFFVSAGVAYLYEAKALNLPATSCKHPRRALALLWLTAALFVIFTFVTPRVGIFRDPLTGGYGI